MAARRFALGIGRHIVRLLAYGLPCVFIFIVVAAVYVLDQKPDLTVWHLADLDEEFTRHSDLPDFAAYFALEERLFAQLEEKVRSRLTEGERTEINRFNPGSRSDPDQIEGGGWNRSYEWPVENPTAVVLLIHGLSDSPYSLRSVAEALHARGAHVLGLRVPGHGTAPSGLVHADWRDWAAAVDLAADHLRAAAPGAPLVFVGYSNGGALTVQHTLAALEQRAGLSAPGTGDDLGSLALPDALVLLCPAIGITPLAALASWQERIGHLTGLEKLQWQSVMPEYDPFKYGSFALNAGKQSYELTVQIRDRVARLTQAGALGGFPPTLAFQSLADATVSTPDVASVFFQRLTGLDHYLTVFDVRRGKQIKSLMKPHHGAWLAGLHDDADRPFDLVIVGNAGHPDTLEVEAHLHPRDAGEGRVEALGEQWPANVFSLAHVAMPFPPDDPVYGGPAAPKSDHIQLGNIAFRGERGVMRVTGNDMLRLRWNPFHAWMLGHIEDWVAQAAAR